MPTEFPRATPEHVITAVEAIVASGGKATHDFVMRFADISSSQAAEAIKSGILLGLLKESGSKFAIANPVANLLAVAPPTDKPAVLRVFVEQYEPFEFFRRRLQSTGTASDAAKQTKISLNLDGDKEDIRQALTSMGTYCHSIVDKGGGGLELSSTPLENSLEILITACNDRQSATTAVSEMVGVDNLELLSQSEVVQPLSQALLHSARKEPEKAVHAAGNAFESFLVWYGIDTGAPVGSASGINSKLDKLRGANKIPKKISLAGYFLGQIRNAADHGTDDDIGNTWIICDETGINYVSIACVMIRNILHFKSTGIWKI